MEARSLALFVLACQHLSHAEAAGAYGISPSALSEAISNMEAALGTVLFLRGPLGHVPTDAARWLFQQAEPMLQMLEVATTPAAVPAVHYLTVASSLHFSFGKLSRVLAAGARDLRQLYPGTVTRVTFQSEPGGSDDLFFTYGRQDDRAIHLFDDDWVVFSATHLPAPSMSLAQLRRMHSLWLPPLPTVLELAIRRYCDDHGLPQPLNLPADADLFASIRRQAEHDVVLAPRSLVVGGAVRHKMSLHQLETPLISPVVAHIAPTDAGQRRLIDAYLAILQVILTGPTPTVLYDPVVSLRQLRLATTLSRSQNMSLAARVLNVAQPALSVQLRKLEQTLGGPMFARHRGGMTLLAEARPRVELFDQALTIAEGIRSGALERGRRQRPQLFVGITTLLAEMPGFRQALAKAIARCSVDHPGIHLRVSEKNDTTLQQELRSGRLDIVVSEQEGPIAGPHHLGDAGVLGVVSFAEAGAAWPSSAAILPTAIVLPPVGSGLRNCADRLCEGMGLVLRDTMDVDSPALGYAIARERGIATILPETVFRALAEEGAASFRPLSPPTMIAIGLETLDRRGLSAIEQAFLRHLRACLPAGQASEIGMAPLPQ